MLAPRRAGLPRQVPPPLPLRDATPELPLRHCRFSLPMDRFLEHKSRLAYCPSVLKQLTADPSLPTFSASLSSKTETTSSDYLLPSLFLPSPPALSFRRR